MLPAGIALTTLLRMLGRRELTTLRTAAAKGVMGTPLPIPVKSQAIKDATYTPDDGVLTITFRNGATYTYVDVPADVVVGFMNAGSQGAYYDNNIKGRY
jgi:KTSC domain